MISGSAKYPIQRIFADAGYDVQDFPWWALIDRLVDEQDTALARATAVIADWEDAGREWCVKREEMRGENADLRTRLAEAEQYIGERLSAATPRAGWSAEK